MNKKGFTLVEVLTVIIVMTLILMIAFPAINKIMEKNNKDMYESYESLMEEYARASNNKSSVIKLSSLDGLEKVKEECSGYVEFNSVTYTYKAYIKCGDRYKTTGYNANKA